MARRLLPLLLIAALCGCSGTSTQNLIDAAFLVINKTFRIITPSSIQVGQDFDVTIDAIDSNSDQRLGNFSGGLTFTLDGSGSLQVISEPGFSGGSQKVTLRYLNPALTGSASEGIVLKVVSDSDAKVSASSDLITAKAFVSLQRFDFVSPLQALSSQDFNITITAMGSDNNTYTGYTGTVNLSVVGSTTGNFSVVAIGPFANGTINVTIQFDQPASALQIKATDQADASITGTSNPIAVGFDALGVSAVSTNTDRVRLSWQTIIGAIEYKIYHEQAGTFIEVGTAGAGDNSFIINSGLTAGNVEKFRVDARKAGSVVLASNTVSETVLTTNCQTNIGTTISTTTFTAALSPYCIAASTTVTAGNKLTVGANAIVRTTGNADITVVGTAEVEFQAGSSMLFDQGTDLVIQSGAKIVIDGNNTSLVLFTSNIDAPLVGNYWGGIDIADGATPTTFTGENYLSGSRVRFAKFEYAVRAIDSSVSLIAEYALFRNVEAANGSGMYMNLTGVEKTVITRSYFGSISSTAIGNGGAVYISSGDANVISNTTFRKIDIGASAVGGAVYFTVTSDNCVIKDNVFDDTRANDGGAIYLNASSNCIISGNSFQAFESLGTNPSGGAIYSLGATSVNTQILSNTFRDRTTSANAEGGAIYMTQIDNFKINDNTFTDITGAYGGVIFARNGADNGEIKNNTFTNSTSTNDGGALNIGGALNLQITGNTFTGSKATGTSSEGGDIFVTTSANNMVISGNTFTNSEAEAGSTGGGSIRIGSATGNIIEKNTFTNTSTTNSIGKGGAIYLTTTGNTIRQNLFSGSTSKDLAGAIYLNANSNIVEYNTFQNCRSGTGGATNKHGGAMWVNNAISSTIRFNIFTGNQAVGPTARGGAIFLNGNAIQPLTLDHNNFSANTDTTTGANHLHNDAETTDFDVQRNWWGQSVAGAADCDDAQLANLCTTLIGNIPTVVNMATSAWPVCTTDTSTPADCVGRPTSL